MRTDMGFTVNGSAAVPPGMMMTQQQQQQQQHSPWHSPVPYLFGGLAAMLGLIAFALLILACSYWKLSGYLEGGSNGGDDGSGDLESGEGKAGDAAAVKGPPIFEEKIVVIMAGDEKPTFLATPMSSRASSFGDNKKSKDVGVVDDDDEKSKMKGDHDHQPMETEGGGGNNGQNQNNLEQEVDQNQNQRES